MTRSTRPNARPNAQPKKTTAAPSARSGTTTKKRAVPEAKASRPKAAPPPPRPQPKAAKPKREVLMPDPAVVAQIRELEAQLDRLIDEASRHDLSSLEPLEPLEPLDPLEPPDDDEVTTVDDQHEVYGARERQPGIATATATESRRAQEQQDLDDAAFDAETTVATPPRSSQSRLGAAPPPPPSSATGGVPLPPESVFDTARELLSTDFYLRKWGKLAMRGRSEEVDDFGADPIYDAKFKTVLDFLYTKYFRVETTGIGNVPAEGRCLLVANHSGTLPLDGVMIKAAVKREQPAQRDVRWLTEDFIYHFPYLGSAMNRLGAVRACQENAERLLGNEHLVAVFPEGVKGIGKLFSERYRLQRFGRGGFIKLCLRTSTPIVPVAVVGAEETNPLLFRLEHLSKALGVPYVPITPTFPILGPLGLLPAPTKWRIQFGEPLDLSAHGPESADDEILVGKLAERVRTSIQGMLDRTVGSRKSVFFG